MKRFLVLCLVWTIVGCEQPETTATTETSEPPPVLNAVAPADLSEIIGTWNPKLNSANQMQWCAQDENGLWECEAKLDIPDACQPVWPVIGSASVLAAGIQFDGTFIYFPEVQTPSYDANTGTVTLSPSGYEWGVAAYNDQAVLTYGAGCSLLFSK